MRRVREAGRRGIVVVAWFSPRWPRTAAQGGRSMSMTRNQITKFLMAYGTGIGIVAGCEAAGVTVAAFQAALGSNARFRAKYQMAEQCLRERALAVVYKAAVEGRSVRAATAYLRLQRGPTASRRASAKGRRKLASNPVAAMLDWDDRDD